MSSYVFFNIVTLLISNHDILYLRTPNKGVIRPYQARGFKGIPINQESCGSPESHPLEEIQWVRFANILPSSQTSDLTLKRVLRKCKPFNIESWLFFQHPKSMGLWYLYIILSTKTGPGESSIPPYKNPPFISTVFWGPVDFHRLFFWVKISNYRDTERLPAW